MAVDEAFGSVVAAALAGLALSVVIERLIEPRPSWVRPWAAWALHAGLCLLAYAGVTLLLGRPWFATAAVSAVFLTLVLVNNAKFKALREPFVFQDYEYFTDAIRHPRLYIPFLGWGRFFAAVAGFVLAVAVGLWMEPVPGSRFAWSGQWGGIAAVLAVGALLLMAGNRKRQAVSFEPLRDVRALGLLASLWRYAQEERAPVAAVSTLDALPLQRPEGDLPHLVAVQSESFFDPRPLFAGIRPEVLAGFDRLKADAAAHGKLQVPAWGANTVRTEFAFLTGIDEDGLGVHRFNPYRAVARGWRVPSLASYLKRLGYRTVCIHPYPASFYQRDRVYPRLAFDEFLDIRAFDDTMRFGPYIGDTAVAEKVAAILGEAAGPVFVFVITMENHGPLHLERVRPSDVDALYSVPPPDGCDDLTIYLRHLRNADRMIAKLRQTLERCARPASLCWFGDHVPIMPSVYEMLGAPNGEVEYVIWRNPAGGPMRMQNVGAPSLAAVWLRMALRGWGSDLPHSSRSSALATASRACATAGTSPGCQDTMT